MINYDHFVVRDRKLEQWDILDFFLTSCITRLTRAQGKGRLCSGNEDKFVKTQEKEIFYLSFYVKGFLLEVNPSLCAQSQVSYGKCTRTGWQIVKKYPLFPSKVAERLSICKKLYNTLYPNVSIRGVVFNPLEQNTSSRLQQQIHYIHTLRG